MAILALDPDGGGLRHVIDDLVDRISRISLLYRRRVRPRLRELTEEPLNRFEVLKWRLRTGQLGRSADGIIVIPLLGIVLVLGVFAATAATRESSRIGNEVSADVVVTEIKSHVVTVSRAGKPKVVTTVERPRARKRVVRVSGGVSTTFESAPRPAGTKTVAGPTKTVTVAGPTKTVTQVVTETVTTVLTVIDDDKPCWAPPTPTC